MKIERRFTTEETGAYGALAFRTTGSEIRNPDGSVVFSLDGIEVPEGWSQVASDILAQKYFRKAGVPAALEAGAREGRAGLPLALGPRRGGAGGAARGGARSVGETSARARSSTASPAAGPTGAGRAATSPPRTTPAPSTTRCATCWRPRWARRTRPQWFNTGLHWAYGIDGPAQGHYYVDFQSRASSCKSTSRLRAPAAARLLHPVGRRRPRQRRRHHGPLDPRGPPLQVRLRHRHQLLLAARRERAALGRRQVLRPDVASSRSATAPPARSSRAAPPAAPPRWSISTSTTPTSRSSSTGRSLEEQKVAALVAGSTGAPRAARRRSSRPSGSWDGAEADAFDPQGQPGAARPRSAPRRSRTCPRPT